MLAAIRSGFADFGITVISCSTCHRSTTWAGVTPCLAAISVRMGLRSRERRTLRHISHDSTKIK